MMALQYKSFKAVINTESGVFSTRVCRCQPLHTSLMSHHQLGS
jgi:hypothetical protein